MTYYERSQLHEKLRFGVGRSESSQSGYWTVKGVKRAADLYIAYSDIRGDMFHISLHDDAEHWQLTLDHLDGRTEHKKLSKPPPLGPGLNRAISLVADPAPVDTPTQKKVHWEAAPTSDTSRWFHVLMEEPFDGDYGSWPGQRSMGTKLVGRVRLGASSTAVVVTNEGALAPERIRLPDEEAKERFVELVGDPVGTTVLCIPFQMEDGTWGARAGRLAEVRRSNNP